MFIHSNRAKLCSATCSGTNVNCYGGNNGSASVTASGGTPSYTYMWSNGKTTSSNNNLSAGTYTATVTDANGCTATCSYTVTQPTLLVASCSGTNVTCKGASTGSAAVVASGGTAPYTYLWSNGKTTASNNGLSAGTYTATVTDSKGCTAKCSYTVTEPTYVVATCTGTNVNCYGGNNGSASVTASGGTPSYTYMWSNGKTTSSNSNLSAGTYTATVTDANGCTATCSYTVTQPTLLVATCSGTNVTCKGASTGSAAVVASGGTAPYTYLWSNGKTTASNNGLSAGTYTATVTDSKGCTAKCSYTVTEPTYVVATCSGTNVNCYGGNNGSASVTASGGTPSYTYLWSNGKTTSSNSNLSAGTYTATVTDANGCTATCSYTVTQPTLLVATCSGTNVTCKGASTGSAAVVASGGTAPYTYLWSNGKTTASNNGLSAGTYTATVTDSKGCTAKCSYTVTEPSYVVATCSGTNVNCYGGNNGSASVTASGGTPSYTYMWSNGKTTSSNSNLSAGTYTATVTDANGCTATCSYTVTQPTLLVATCSGTNVTCKGASTGSAAVVASGGTAPYTYLWSNGKTTASNNGLSAGTYTATVTDSKGCTAKCSYTVTEPSYVVAMCSGTNVNCYGGNNGSASVTASGGTPSYTYMWSNGKTTSSNNNLSAGTYTATVTDANGCTATCSYTVTQPTLLVANCSGTPISCNGKDNGTASVSATGGKLPYTYLWSNGKTTSTIIGLMAATYSATVTDANGCVSNCVYTVTQPTPLVAVCSKSGISCFGGNNSTATMFVSGGTPPYAFLWNTGATTSTISGLYAGNYTVTVTDANNCQSSCTLLIDQPDLLTATCTGTNLTCNGGSTGSANISASGGTGSYTYLWSNGATTSGISNLGAGVYTATVTDINGCTASCVRTITQPVSIVITMSGSNATCNNNGTAQAVAVGGVLPYTYLWSNGATTSSISGLFAGTYSVKVTDAAGCSKNGTYTVTQSSSTVLTLTGTNVLCYGASNGTAVATAVGGSPFTYLWSNGKTTKQIGSLSAGIYAVTVTNNSGCTYTASINITSPSTSLTCQASSTSSQGGSCTGTLTVSSTGGTAPYTYLWSNGATTWNVTGVCAGPYIVTVTDANGCTCSKTVKIDAVVAKVGNNSQYVQLSLSPNPTDGIVNIKFGTDEILNYTLNIMDVNGRIVSSEMRQSVEGENTLSVDLSTLDKGVYLVKIDAGGYTHFARVVLH
ncbi:MAG: T9SS type A sorting domain-containing protein [Bacteroidetes bacterium]|nr:T9SS type A sorting domain-containing protein [Bacteroidota bacterium]